VRSDFALTQLGRIARAEAAGVSAKLVGALGRGVGGGMRGHRDFNQAVPRMFRYRREFFGPVEEWPPRRGIPITDSTPRPSPQAAGHRPKAGIRPLSAAQAWRPLRRPCRRSSCPPRRIEPIPDARSLARLTSAGIVKHLTARAGEIQESPFYETVVASRLIAERNTNALVLVHRQQLLEQWVARLSAFLDIGSDRIGVIRGGRKRPTGVVDVATIQSLVRKGEVADLVADYGHLVVDECHHLSAVSFEAVARAVKARYVLGLSATVTRKDGHHPIILTPPPSPR
jgi:Type III restriction enzyme, res subunit